MRQALRYFFDEATASLWRGYKASLIAIATIATAFVVLGGFLILLTNIERVFARWQEAAEFSVYLTDAATAPQRAEVEKTIRASDLVSSVELVSKDEALRRFRQNFSELANAAGQLSSNPLPASVEVRLRPNVDAAAIEALAGSTARLPGVADVSYDRRWIERLLRGVGVLRAGGFTLAAILVLAAALTVASVIRLALFARRDEIHIMQLVGAPIAYIKGPFVVEGLIQGGVGAGLAIVILWGAFVLVGQRLDAWLSGAIEPAALVFLSLPTAVLLLTAGMAVGAIGGFIAAQSTREVLD